VSERGLFDLSARKVIVLALTFLAAVLVGLFGLLLAVGGPIIILSQGTDTVGIIFGIGAALFMGGWCLRAAAEIFADVREQKADAIEELRHEGQQSSSD
jgi:hypothetical protein